MDTAAGIIIFTFWTTFFTALSVKGLFRPRHDLIESRLEKLVRAEGGKQAPEKKIAVPQTVRESLPAIQRVKVKLLLAGLKRRSDLEKFLLFQRVCFITPLIALVVLSVFLRASVEITMIGGALSGIVFIFIPRFWLMHATLKRRKEIKKHLSDTLDLLVVALEAGLSFDSALVRVGEEQRRISTHISREFLFTNQQILVGKSREEALAGLANRCKIEEVDSFVRAVIQSNKLGSSLVKTLRAQADALRKKRRQEIHAQIIKAPVKLIFPLLFFIFPTLVIVILGPALTQIFRHLSVSGRIP